MRHICLIFLMSCTIGIKNRKNSNNICEKRKELFRMKKKIATVFLMLTMVFAVCLTGCSNDDNDMNTPESEGDNIVDKAKDDVKDAAEDVKKATN